MMKTSKNLMLTALLAASLQAQADEQRPHCVDVAVFAINDFHAAFEASRSNNIPGAPRLWQTLDSLKAVYPYHLTVSAGDNFGGSYFYKLTEKRSLMPRLMKDLGIHISALGNHEFDDGQTALADKWSRVENRPNGWDITYLGANCRNDAGKIPAFAQAWAADTIMLPNGKPFTVALIGLITSNTPNQAKASRLTGLHFDGNYKGVIDSLLTTGEGEKIRKSNLCLLLTHIGTYMKNGKPTWDDRDSANLASIDQPFIDGIITGHSHERVSGRINKAQYPVVQARSHGAHISFLQYKVDTTTMQVVEAIPQTVAVNPSAPLAPGPNRLQAQIDELLGTTYLDGGLSIGTQLTVAKQDIPHNRKNKHRQSPIGGWVCTAFAEALRKEAHLGNDDIVVGVSHFGTIRNGIAAGPVKVINVGEILPFANAIRCYRFTGKELARLIEHGLKNQRYGWIQMGNLQASLNAKGKLDRMVYRSPEGKEKVIGPKDCCYVAADEYMTTGGDGYPEALFPATAEMKVKGLPTTTNAFIQYLKGKPYLDESIR